ncbi:MULTISPECIES: zf-HC2 domain-containing protein [Paenibacillus]|uniref:Anti-sigma-W factor RsiW n=1 Tax=Paenibacillus taichungensis TaxID=484184 RepID=A0A329QIT4_9BACL|nr:MULTISPECIES: zf-HC2 domain-containing protein [Paenibacillus]MDR9749035.1 zf-HC2 domain-containing protein [Paenibacillus taichungensis]MEC0110694.1 zf-HC2 domain-containing protein [Paenibacillus taichungensis]MEC0125780.1 zf-HC2 domain-containing protein [Paenibacillus pabuli]MEC0197978.1 zf-HC2 domain-containing protein [Paenibacillus taichungensis]NEU64485.1 anti-sigma factor [Paenibacillus sp. ALJ109b]
MDCNSAVSLMHECLDESLSPAQKVELKSHLVTCPDCRMRFKELEQTEMLLFAMKHYSPSASDELTNRIMNALPQPKRQQVWLKWVKGHPALTAAAFFLVVMLFSAWNFWNQNNEMVVKGNNLDQIVIEGNTVIVPEGKSIAGDLTIENGTAQVYGDVNGNLTVIDGQLYQASTAHISGQVKSIDQALDWFWYKITNMVNEVAYR